MKTFNQLIEEALTCIEELFPWDLEEKLASDSPPMVVDVREEHEWNAMHIDGSIFAPRGVLEQCCEWNYDETIPELVQAREREIVVVCRSGNRSVLAACTMHTLGYQKVYSLKTGIRGWNDYDQPLVDKEGETVDPDEAEVFLANKVREDQKGPQ